jgi:hypothetical protein
MRIHRMDASWSEKLQHMEIGIVFMAMIDTCLQFRQFGETSVIQHIFYRY